MQIGFIDFLVLPLFKSYGRVLSHGDDLVNAIVSERERWEKVRGNKGKEDEEKKKGK